MGHLDKVFWDSSWLHTLARKTSAKSGASFASLRTYVVGLELHDYFFTYGISTQQSSTYGTIKVCLVLKYLGTDTPQYLLSLAISTTEPYQANVRGRYYLGQ